MTRFRGSWHRPGAVVTAAAAGLIGVGLCAAPASAHTPQWTVSCSEVNVDLTAYNGNVTNTVTISADGKDLLPTETFKNEFHKKLEIPSHSSEVAVHLVVKAGDGDRYSVDQSKTSPACESAPTTPSATPTTEAPKPSATPSETASEAVPATPSSSPSGDLAETGSSSSTPIIAGTAAVVVLAGGAILMATRKRRATARH